MELDLVYTDYTVVGLTNPNTLKSFHSSESKYLKVAIGDRDGVLQVFSIKNDELLLNFKTLPGEPISSLDVGLSQGNGGFDKIFIASGTEIKGFSKKGKLFFGIETNLAEPIIAMRVYEADLLVVGAHSFTHYRDGKDIGNYICGDTIVDIAAIQIPNSNRVVGIIACRGGSIHAIERGRVLAIVRLPTSPCILFPSMVYSKTEYVFCGAIDGSLYNLSLDREHGSINVQTYTDIKKPSSISAAGWWEGVSTFQNPLLLLGYSNGCIQIYNLQNDISQNSPQLLFSYNCEESITSIVSWSKGIVVATRSGRIFGLATEVDVKSTNIKINKLKEEIQELEVQVEKERAQYRIATQPLSSGLSAIPALQINEEWGPVEGDGARKLCISLGAPLDILLLQSTAPLRLFDTAPNAALLTRAFQTKGNNELLATYRCQANTQQLEMRVGIWLEGIDTSGELCIYVTPLLQPKCCQLIKYFIHPLSWHVPEEEHQENESCNILIVLGAFSKVEIHAWLCRLLPELPSRPTSIETSVNYRSVITETTLHCHYQKGKAEFRSENISTISIIKDFLSREATKKKIQLEISCKLNNNSFENTIRKIHPKIMVLFDHLKEMKIKNALSELQINDDIQNGICKEYVELLSRSTKNNYERHLDLQQLYDIITNLFMDGSKLKGINIKNKIPELKTILEEYDLETVLSFFKNNLKLI